MGPASRIFPGHNHIRHPDFWFVHRHPLFQRRPVFQIVDRFGSFHRNALFVVPVSLRRPDGFKKIDLRQSPDGLERVFPDSCREHPLPVVLHPVHRLGIHVVDSYHSFPDVYL